MKLFSIVNLDINHIDEICSDIKEQYEKGISNCALFSMTLTPEGTPVSDKASILCEKYAKFKAKLDGMGLRSGILVQATIGHGWVLGEESPFTKYTGFDTGTSGNICCPYDEDFRKYIYDAFVKIAKCNPCHIMVDDDLRLISGRSNGCACHLHIAKFNEYAKTDMDRETLYKIVTTDSDKKKEYTDIFVRTQMESMVELADMMRGAIDSVNPKIPGSFCCVGRNAEFAYEIASALAGEGNEIIVRINQGHYCEESNHKFSYTFLKAAQGIEKLKGKVDVILAETDTCPQCRYSTSAMSLHTQFTGTILEGVDGAKHWITKLDNYEPQSGKAYRRVLSKYAKFYEKLAEIAPTLKWRGFRIPVRDKAIYEFENTSSLYANRWCIEVLERLGLPVFYSSETKGITTLEGKLTVEYTDEKLKEILSGSVVLASDTAKLIIDRGFGEYLGVDIREWDGKTPITEELMINGYRMKIQQNSREIVPLSDDVIIDSKVYTTKDRVNYEYLFPGTTIYKNSLGGQVVVFCGTPAIARFGLTTAFSFLSYGRKLQLANIMHMLGEDVCFYPEDEEVYMKTADMEDGNIFCAIFNLGFDSIEDIKVATNKNVIGVKRLTENGEFVSVDFKTEINGITTNVSCQTLEPVILVLEVQK